MGKGKEQKKQLITSDDRSAVRPCALFFFSGAGVCVCVCVCVRARVSE